jgi:hypothetical protein
MDKTRITNIGLLAVAVLSAGVLASRIAQANPTQCKDKCSESKYVKQCTTGIYSYFTKPSCYLCGKLGTWNCDDRSLPNTCIEKNDDPLKIKIITSTEFCPCTVGMTNYTYAEANPVDAGTVTSDETPRWRCEAAPDPNPGEDEN